MAKELSLSLGSGVPVSAWEPFFTDRPHYSVVEDPDGQGLHALYSNPDTEVGFSIAWRAGASTFRLAQDRPRPFALEAEPELAAFAARFKVDVPSGTLLEAWEAARPKSKAAGALPSARVDQIWRWNLGRLALGRSLELFVPRIWVTKEKSALKTGVDWEPDVPAALPEVDLIWVSWAGTGGERLVPRAKLAETLDGFPGGTDAFPYRRVGEAGDLEPLLAQIAKRPKTKSPLHLAFGALREFDGRAVVATKRRGRTGTR